MHLDGAKKDIELIELVIGEMMLVINNQGFINPEDVKNYIKFKCS